MSFNRVSRDSRSSLRDARLGRENLAIEQADEIPAYKHGDVESIHLEKKITISDPVFGDIEEDGPNYRNVGWVGTAFLMIKTQIGIGVLSIPAAFNTLGFVPGIVTLIAVAVITTWSDYVVGCFKLRHLEMYGIDDAGYIMFGRIGREVFAVAFLLYWVFVSGSAILSISIGLNAVSSHATCTAVFVAVAAVATFVLSSIPTLSKMSWLAAAGAISILVSILTLTIAVGVQDRPATAPTTGPFIPDTQIIAHPDFAEIMSAVATIIFAFSGTPAFFPIVAEMRNPQHYVRSMLICQATVCTVYLAIGVVVYTYCGSYVASPALGSAGPLMKKVCYGLALPGLLVSGTMVSHFPAKYLFVRLLRNTPHLTTPSPTHYLTWLACTFSTVTVAYIIASAVPNFSSLIALIGALLGTFICFQPMGCMWLYDNWNCRGEERGRDWRWWGMVGWSCFVIAAGCFCMVGGSYGAVVGLVRDYGGDGGGSRGAWGCGDNSGST